MVLKFDFSKFDKKLTAITKGLEREGRQVIKETSEQAIKIIVARTRRKNTDFNGRKFRPYSPAYVKQRAKQGASSRVVLTSTGKTSGGRLRGNAQGGTMLNSLVIVRTEDKGLKNVISIARVKELEKMTRHVRGEGNLPKRNPLGFTKKEDAILTKRASVQLVAVIRRIGKA